MSDYRALICSALEGPGALRLESFARRRLTAGEVRVAMRAAAVGFPDLLMTYGKYQLRLDPPFTPGMEFAGEILELGPEVEGLNAGDRVITGIKGGAMAEEVIVSVENITSLPPALSFAEGAAYKSGAITALHALVDRGQIAAGETLLILGASGGVGMAAIHLAKHLGAHVIGTGSTQEKRAAILSAGADHALDPSAADFLDQVKSLTSGGGVDLVYDPVGGDLALTATRTLAWGGRYLIVGFASGTIPKFPANHALIKGYSLIGLRAGESGRRDPALGARNAAKLAKYAAAGVMRPHISHQIPLDRAQEAFEALENRAVIGRAVVVR